jgi:hypothetical protein
MEKSYWWCHHCGVKVAPATVTFEICHNRCGHTVEHITPEEVGLVEQLRTEINRLQDQLVQLVSFETTEKRNEALLRDRRLPPDDYDWCSPEPCNLRGGQS